MLGEQGETIYYLSVDGLGVAALGLREERSDAHDVPHDRYAIGLHHLCFDVPSREVVDERAHWLRDQGARIESGPAEYAYAPGYYAVFFYDRTESSSSCFTVRPTGSGFAAVRVIDYRARAGAFWTLSLCAVDDVLGRVARGSRASSPNTARCAR